MRTRNNGWPRGATIWYENGVGCASVPFTWECARVAETIRASTAPWWFVGGPGAVLQPEAFEGVPNVMMGRNWPGVLQRVNPRATRTTTGCVRRCGFCAVPQTEGAFRELEEWPDLPVLCDNNITAASEKHWHRVMDRLDKYADADFTQGIDCRLLKPYHAERLARHGKMPIRLALDSNRDVPAWTEAWGLLRGEGIPKRRIRSYVLVGEPGTSVDDAWARCTFVKQHGALPLPMWWHPLDACKRNAVTDAQMASGWSDYERRRIMQWFYQHKRAVPCRKSTK